jgi:hypothetical protein
VARSLERWFSFRRNANFGDWLQEQYSEAELRQLVKEATDCDLFRPWDPWANPSNDPFSSVEVDRRELSRALIKRYGAEIWEACQAAGGLAGGGGRTGIHCFAHLDLASQVYSLDAFNEFLVRNAMKHLAPQVLENRSQRGVTRGRRRWWMRAHCRQAHGRSTSE